MKSLFKLIKLLLTVFVVGVIALLFVNKTFIYEEYNSDDIAVGIPIRRFTYLYDNKDNELKFITPLNNNYLASKKDDYLKSLESCLGIYYYDKNNDITITEYKITDKDYFRNINISYVKDNYCSDKYILSYMWFYEYINLTEFISGDITEKAMNGLIDKLYNSKRVETPIIKDYESKVSLSVNLKLLDDDYTLIFSDFSENELMVRKEMSNNQEFVIYEVEDTIDYLNSLELAKK